MNSNCNHFNIEKLLKAKAYECEECIKVGDGWVHLRTCQECGATLCCDNSPNKHATKHYHKSGHPVVISAEPDENWAWCYVDQEFTEY